MLKRFDDSLIIKPIRGNDNGCVININGQVKNKFMDNLETSINEDGDKCVSLTYLGKPGTYRVVDLMATHFKFMDEFTDEQLDQVIGFHVNGEKDHFHAGNIGYRFKNGKLEIPGYKDFYYIPGSLERGIREDGTLLSTKTWEILKWGKTPPNPEKNIIGGYLVNRITNGRNSVRTISRHRSLMLVFKPYPDNCDFLIVNHLNGIPGDDDLSNLEWSSKKGNIDHAYASGLRSQNKPVLARNVLTKKVTEYYSVEECARQLGLKGQTINFRLEKCKFSSVNRDGYQFKYKDDSRDWIKPKNPQLAINKAIQNSPFKVRDCSTLKEYTCTSLGKGFTLTGVKGGTIWYRLAKGLKGPCFGWQFIFEDDESGFPDFDKEEYEESLKPKIYKVDGRNLITGEERVFDSMFAVAKELKIFPRQELKQNKQTVYPCGWQFKFQDNHWRITDPAKEVYESQQDIMAKNIQTGEITYAKSARALESILKLNNQQMRKAALTRGEKEYHGYLFKLGTQW